MKIYTCLLLLLLTSPTLAQTTRYVSATGPNNNPATATNWAISTSDLQGAINASVSGDQVWVAGGLYKPTQTTGPASRTISFTLKNGVAVYGGLVGNEASLGQRPVINPVGGQPSSSTLSGEIGNLTSTTDNSYHVVSTTALTNSAVLNGFVITAGNADYTYTVSSTGFGAGIYNTASSPTLQNLSFLNNKAIINDGGGLYNTAGSNPVITNCLFSGNSAINGYGGGMSNYGSSPVLTNVSFVKNNSYSGGGGMGNSSGSSPLLTNVSFVSNYAGDGGGVYNSSSSSPSLINVAFINNYGAYRGGGLYNGSPIPTLYNVSFLNNQVGLTGSGFGGGAIYNGSTLSLRNCILFGNGGSNSISGNGFTATFSLFESTVTGYSSSTTNLTTAVSPFAATNGVALATCSPAINTGSNGGVIQFITTDLVGNPRLVGARVDMGAVEFQAAPSPAARLYVNASATGANTGLTWADALTDLQSALTYPCSQSLAEVWVAGGLYKPTQITGPASRTISFTLKNGVAVYGGFVGNETSLGGRPVVNPINGQPSSSTLSGEIGDPTSTTDNSYHVVITRGLTTSAVLDGFVITAGDGGYGSDGGGIENSGGNTRFSNILLQNNRSRIGGGMYNAANSVLTNVVFQSNTALTDGGGIYNSGGVQTLINVIFQNNLAYNGFGGGGMYNSGGSYTLINSAFLNNRTSTYLQGGGIYNTNCSPILINVSMQGNQAASGSAIYNYINSKPVLTNCIIFNNGISSVINANNTTTVRYSLFEPGLEMGVGMNVSGPGNLTTTVSPFASPNSVALATNALAINAGNVASYTAANGPATDLLGNARIVGGGIDMGAVEFQGGSGAVYTVQNGSWSDASTWNVNRLPVASESIGVYHAVQVNGLFQIKRVVYGPGGRLIFSTGGRIQFQ